MLNGKKMIFSDVALRCKINALYDFNPYFQGLARNLEQPEVKDWLTETKDQLMGDKSGKDKDEEGKKINAIIVRQVQLCPNLLHTRDKSIFQVLRMLCYASYFKYD